MSNRVKRNPVRDKMIILSNNMGIGLSVIAVLIIILSSYSFVFDILMTVACCCLLWYCYVSLNSSSTSLVKLSRITSVLMCGIITIIGGYHVLVITKEQILNGYSTNALPIFISVFPTITAFRSPAFQMISVAIVYIIPSFCLDVIIITMLKKKKNFIKMSDIYRISAVGLIGAFSGLLFCKFSLFTFIMIFLFTILRTAAISAVMLRIACRVNAVMNDDRKRCKKCGNIVSREKKFCTRCGTSIE